MTMAEAEQIRHVLHDLIEVLQLQARQIEKLSTQVGRHAGSLYCRQEMPAVVSQLSGLHRRMKALDESFEASRQAS
jgi:hypothetical protein